MTAPLFNQATDPSQYDSDQISWADLEHSLSDNGTRSFYYRFLSRYISHWKNKRVIDIGCGTGWLVDGIRKSGAEKVIGIDPSQKNIAKGLTLYPRSNLIKIDLHSFSSLEKYDVAISILALGHLGDINAALRKIKNMLVDRGELYLIIADYDYFKSQRHNYRLTIENLNDSEYIERAIRGKASIGNIASIVRKVSVYLRIALDQKLDIIELTPLVPEREHLTAGTQMFEKFIGKPIAHLIRMKKQ